jgi:hypothetical protein
MPFPGRPGGEHDEPLLDMLFGARALPPGAPPEMHDLARMLTALAGPADPGELAGEAAAVAAFSRITSPAGISPRSPSPGPAGHRPSPRPASRRPVRRTTLAKALLGAAAMVGGIAAAYTGALPRPIQQVAHITINAPAPPPAARQPAVKPRKHGPVRPTPVPASQPAAPSSAPTQIRWPGLGSTPTPSASSGCGPGLRRPPSLVPIYPGSTARAQASCPAPATPTPSPKASPSASAKATATATKAPGTSGQTPTS